MMDTEMHQEAAKAIKRLVKNTLVKDLCKKKELKRYGSRVLLL
jgi:hypothetical protein